ncbi:HAMP domain-containing sensor histidine kinase [Pseudarthrobacter sp. P1]|uniref:HAMP domain-containing sensor histidine kinase n=1 Tax=Pseudarthrobacter sp. P1 TaxID=3418418 RepID=UPI003CF18A58
MVLLTAICAVVGMVSYTAVQLSLDSQLDAALASASHRAAAFGGAGSSGGSTGSGTPRPNPLDARGTGVGTFTARLAADGTVASAGILSVGTAQPQITNDDARILAELAVPVPTDGQPPVQPAMNPVDRTLSIGDYRLAAVGLSTGETIVTGLPLEAQHNTLVALLRTIVVVSAAGLLALGLVGTIIIRRTLRPLEELSAVATRVSKLQLDAGEVALAERVPPAAANPATEVGNVGHAFNNMLDNVANALEARQRSEMQVRRFVADASHELRTPLTAIRGYTELLRISEDLTPDGGKSLERVEQHSARMARLVEDLLLLARLDEGRAPQRAPMDLTEVLVETVSDVQVAAPGHRWELDLPEDPVVVQADAEQLRALLLNLLSNAHKHTPPGTTVVAGMRQSPGGSVVVTVSDNGPGVPEAFQDKAFDRFARADSARSGAVPSTGLGLAIVQAIAQAHGARISLSSRPGFTRFSLELPAS